jgi:hypothetical protein
VLAALLGLLALTTLPWARPRRAAAAILAAGTVLGWAFQLSLLAFESEGTWRTLLARAASRTISSYHSVAASEDARDPLAFLRNHAQLLEGYRIAAKHAATHPPGPVLFYRAAIGACAMSPRLTDGLLDLAGMGDRDFRSPDARARRAGALLGALLLGLLGAATVWPAASLAETLGLEPLGAARVGLLFGVVPAAALMVPEFDQVVAFLVAGVTALLASAIVTRTGAWPKALLAGAGAAVAVFTSYGAAVFLAIGGLCALALTPAGADRRRGVAVLALSAATGAALTAATALLGHDPLASARTALAIHREVYTAPRSYPLWLLFNPLDLAIFLGPPLTGLALRRLGRAARRPWSPPPFAGSRFLLTIGAGVLVLVLSGITRGEVGRLWLPLTPLILVGVLSAPEDDGGPGAGADGALALVIAAVSAAVCVAIRGSWEL